MIKVLNQAISAMDKKLEPIVCATVNPKAITINNLYGYINLMTNEWNDGIIGKIFREAEEDERKTRFWLVFDG